MANFLAYDRTNSQVVTIDTISGTVANLGPALITMETTSIFSLRSAELLTIYLGDPYILTLRSDNTVIVHYFDGAAWLPRTATFPALNGGTMKPIGLHIINDRLIAVFLETGGAAPIISYVDTTDGTTWSAVSSLAVPTMVGEAGHSITWKNSILAATDQGVVVLEAGVGWLSVIYTGSDNAGAGTGLQQLRSTLGCFARWQGGLYFMQPDTTLPKLYLFQQKISLSCFIQAL
mgnify:CR=1 FL=1